MSDRGKNHWKRSIRRELKPRWNRHCAACHARTWQCDGMHFTNYRDCAAEADAGNRTGSTNR